MTWHVTKHVRFPPRRFDSFPAQAGSPPADGGAVGTKYRQPGSADGSEESQGGDSCKLLIAVWHVLTGATADRFAAPEQMAAAFYALAYKMGVRNLPEGVGARQYVRDQLDRLGLGDEITHIPWGSKRFKLPPSRVGESAA